ncbi:MAG: surface-adhesin E family protein [Nitrosospira sp.]
MRKLLVATAIAALPFSSPSLGDVLGDATEGWEKIGESSTESIFINPDSVDMQDNLISLWVRNVHTKPQTFKNQQYLTDEVKLGYHCLEHWVVPIAMKKTAGPDGSGEIIQSELDTTKKGRPIGANDPIYNNFVKELCEQFAKR